MQNKDADLSTLKVLLAAELFTICRWRWGSLRSAPLRSLWTTLVNL